MDKSRERQRCRRLRQRLLKVAKKKMGGVRDAVGMGGDGSIEREDLALGQHLPQMIESAAVSQAQFEDRPWYIGNQHCGQIDARALCCKAPDRAVQTAHPPQPGKPASHHFIWVMSGSRG